jgi:hypothetical protein
MRLVRSRVLDQELIEETLGSLEPARIGLVPAARPADVLALIGWEGASNWYRTALPIAAVLRSWEDRFGARLLEVGFAEISLLVSRPPHDVDAARRIAAEHFVFCDESGEQGFSDIPLAARGCSPRMATERQWLSVASWQCAESVPGDRRAGIRHCGQGGQDRVVDHRLTRITCVRLCAAAPVGAGELPKQRPVGRRAWLAAGLAVH